jgi:hypothetical protein
MFLTQDTILHGKAGIARMLNWCRQLDSTQFLRDDGEIPSDIKASYIHNMMVGCPMVLSAMAEVVQETTAGFHLLMDEADIAKYVYETVTESSWNRREHDQLMSLIEPVRSGASVQSVSPLVKALITEEQRQGTPVDKAEFIKRLMALVRRIGFPHALPVVTCCTQLKSKTNTPTWVECTEPLISAHRETMVMWGEVLQKFGQRALLPDHLHTFYRYIAYAPTTRTILEVHSRRATSLYGPRSERGTVNVTEDSCDYEEEGECQAFEQQAPSRPPMQRGTQGSGFQRDPNRKTPASEGNRGNPPDPRTNWVLPKDDPNNTPDNLRTECEEHGGHLNEHCSSVWNRFGRQTGCAIPWEKKEELWIDFRLENRITPDEHRRRTKALIVQHCPDHRASATACELNDIEFDVAWGLH